jgi:hypothetical protein
MSLFARFGVLERVFGYGLPHVRLPGPFWEVTTPLREPLIKTKIRAFFKIERLY